MALRALPLSRPPLPPPLVTLSALALGLALAASPAHAAGTDGAPGVDAQRLSDQAVEAYGAGRYEETIRLFKQAYSLRAEPTILYNIARAQEKLGQGADALESYRRYLVSEGTDAKLRQKAEARVAALSTKLEKGRNDRPDKALRPDNPDKGPDKGSPDKGSPDKGVQSGQPQPPPRLVAVTPPPPPAPPPWWRTPLFLSGAGLCGVGVVGLAVGGGLHAAAASKADPVVNNTTNDEAQKRAARDQAQGLATGALVGYVIGGAALAGGAALVGLATYRHMNGEKTTKVTLLPLPQAGGAQLAILGGF